MLRTLAAAACALLMAGQAQAAGLAQARVAQGLLSAGPVEQGVTVFKGVPFAAPPVGPLRWRAPQAAAAWSGVRPADRFGANCMQKPIEGALGPWTPEYLAHGDISEDCLYLNVWTPAEGLGAKLPVMVWIPGGGFNQGSGSVPIYDGAGLARRGVVVVTVNYRLNAFGFMAHPQLTAEGQGASGNYGLQDQIAALQWVQANIAAFGGDPARVTVAGQSAGAASVHALLAAPAAKGLFHQAIAQSGSGMGSGGTPLAKAEQDGVRFAEGLGARTLAELRALPADKVLETPSGMRFAPIIDGRTVPADPTRPGNAVSDVPLLTGLTADESSGMNRSYGKSTPAELQTRLQTGFGALARQAGAIYRASSDADAGEASKRLSRDRGLAATWLWAQSRLQTSRQPVYAYLWTHVEPGPEEARYGAFHSSEMPYVFQTLAASPERPFTQEDRRISDQMAAYWANFIAKGDPNGQGLPTWPKVRAGSPVIMELGARPAPRPVLEPETLKLFQAYAEAGGGLSLF
ncbi:carboxylesterase/lipase family protein [Phenylobacterium deserti]|nr:carboxylesterase family protein [Phenylobacterium deserti]